MLTPRENPKIIGHERTISRLLEAWKQKRVPHALSLSGPKGIGKATLAFHFARFLLAGGDIGVPASLFGDAPDSLAMDKDHPIFHRVSAASHPDLLVVEPQFDERKKALRRDIVVDDIRKVTDFLALTPAESDWRVVIVDSADAMNVNAANALLKILEEPPKQSVLLLVCHHPGVMLPTIHSRCQSVPVEKLTEEQVSEVLSHIAVNLSPDGREIVNMLSGGSPGAATELYEQGAAQTYISFLDTLESDKFLDYESFAGAVAKSAEPKQWAAFRIIIQHIISRIISIRSGAEDATLYSIPQDIHARLEQIANGRPLDYWLELWSNMNALLIESDTLHLDRKQIVLDIMQNMHTKKAA